MPTFRAWRHNSLIRRDSSLSKDSQPDHHEFAALFVKSQRQIYGYILTIVPDPNDADDILQETSLILWNKLRQFATQQDFTRWACGIARNVIRNWRVKQSRDRHVFSEAMIEELAEVREERSEWLERCSAALTVCIGKLSDAQQRILKLFYRGNVTATDIAEEFDTTENNIYQRLHRIRRRLAICVQKVAGLGDDS